MFVITGATGQTGSVAANALLDQGKPVRVLVRSADKAARLRERGAEIVIGELANRAALERAFTGASAVYLLSPPDTTPKDFIPERKALLESVVGVARAANVPHVVFLSSIGAQHADGTGPIRTLHAGEQALGASGLPSTFVRAAYFVENWAAVLPVAQKDGVLPSFLPATLSIPMVTTGDIGRVVAQALLAGPRGRRIVELSGAQDASAADVASALSRILGRQISVAEAPLDAVVPTFTSFGMSENIAGLYREMYEGVRTGQVAWEGQGAEAQRGTTNLEQALRGLLG